MVPCRNLLIRLVRPPTECACGAAQPISFHVRIKVGVTNESGTQPLKLKHWRKGMRKGSTGCKCWWWPLAKISVTSSDQTVRGGRPHQRRNMKTDHEGSFFPSVCLFYFWTAQISWTVFGIQGLYSMFLLRWIWLIPDRLGVRDATPKTAVRLVVAWPYK